MARQWPFSIYAVEIRIVVILLPPWTLRGKAPIANHEHVFTLWRFSMSAFVSSGTFC
jgi:hypothetical protein